MIAGCCASPAARSSLGCAAICRASSAAQRRASRRPRPHRAWPAASAEVGGLVPILLPRSGAPDGDDAVPAPNGLAPRFPGVPTLQSAFRATQLEINTALKQLAIPAGFEPATLCLEGRCSSPAELRDRVVISIWWWRARRNGFSAGRVSCSVRNSPRDAKRRAN